VVSTAGIVSVRQRCHSVAVTAIDIVPGTGVLVEQCLGFDHVARGGDLDRCEELSQAAVDGRMRVAVAAGRAVGYSVMAPWFLGAPFVSLVYVDESERGRGIGRRLVADCEQHHGLSRIFTSTNLTNARMQRLLEHRGWIPCGMLHGLDEGDPEIFYAYHPKDPTVMSL
jgi:GNAT superfamily N-acetyltransferase